MIIFFCLKRPRSFRKFRKSKTKRGCCIFFSILMVEFGTKVGARKISLFPQPLDNDLRKYPEITKCRNSLRDQSFKQEKRYHDAFPAVLEEEACRGKITHSLLKSLNPKSHFLNMSFSYNGVRETYGFHHFQVRDVRIVNWRDSQAGKKKGSSLCTRASVSSRWQRFKGLKGNMKPIVNSQ